VTAHTHDLFEIGTLIAAAAALLAVFVFALYRRFQRRRKP